MSEVLTGRQALHQLARMSKYGDGPDDLAPDGEDAMRVLNWYIEGARAALLAPDPLEAARAALDACFMTFGCDKARQAVGDEAFREVWEKRRVALAALGMRP